MSLKRSKRTSAAGWGSQMMAETTFKTCIVCGKEIVHDKFHPYQKFCSKRCKWRLRSRNEQKRKRYHELRFEALGVLGGKCSICSIDDPCMLTIDHVDGDWRRDPFSRRNKRALYRHIVQNREAAKNHFQVLCWNHNSMKSLYPEVFESRYPAIR